MQAFSYRAPTTLEDAVSILAAAGPAARPLAGGTDLIVQLRHGRRRVDMVIDIKRIREVGALEFTPEGGLVLGAAVPCADVATHADVITHYPALADGAGLIGGAAVRQRATVGGNLCNASPSGDAIPPLSSTKALTGHSLGGYFAFYSLFNSDHIGKGVFTNYVAASPWLQAMTGLKNMDTFEKEYFERNQTLPASMYVTAGGLESAGYRARISNLCATVTARGYEGLWLTYEDIEGESHNSVFGPTVTDALRFFYGT